jgi:acyl-CoA reductase-like NAD-dependent aldehyde dehydrogenase
LVSCAFFLERGKESFSAGAPVSFSPLSRSLKTTTKTLAPKNTNKTKNNPKTTTTQGNVLTASETVRKLGFTGSTAVGKKLAAAAAGTAKRLSLELGGNAPFLVFPDADLELAARGVVSSALRNAGQTCICVNRAFVHESVAEEFAALVAARVRALKAGDGASEGTTLGPLISRAAVEKTKAHVSDAVGKGAVVVIGGAGQVPEGLAEGLAKGGNWHAATVLDRATIDM